MLIDYRNSSALLAVIGDPIGHSLSPLLQNTMLRELGEDAVYLAFSVKAGEVSGFLEAAKALNIRGFNLTMPHKEDIIPHLTAMTEEARLSGSVNSVRLRNGVTEGHSTDGIGFRRGMQELLGVDFPGKAVTILGAGGAAKSIAATALRSGAWEIHVMNRTLSRAQALCKGNASMIAHNLSEDDTVLPNTDILISTLPTGMEGVGSTFDAVDLRLLKSDAVCADCIYAPARTPFMETALRLGHPAINGIGMLVYQAVYALEFFLEREFSQETVTTLGKKLLEISGVDPYGSSI